MYIKRILQQFKSTAVHFFSLAVTLISTLAISINTKNIEYWFFSTFFKGPCFFLYSLNRRRRTFSISVLNFWNMSLLLLIVDWNSSYLSLYMANCKENFQSISHYLKITYTCINHSKVNLSLLININIKICFKSTCTNVAFD